MGGDRFWSWKKNINKVFLCDLWSFWSWKGEKQKQSVFCAIAFEAEKWRNRNRVFLYVCTWCVEGLSVRRANRFKKLQQANENLLACSRAPCQGSTSCIDVYASFSVATTREFMPLSKPISLFQQYSTERFICGTLLFFVVAAPCHGALFKTAWRRNRLVSATVEIVFIVWKWLSTGTCHPQNFYRSGSNPRECHILVCKPSLKERHWCCIPFCRKSMVLVDTMQAFFVGG